MRAQRLPRLDRGACLPRDSGIFASGLSLRVLEPLFSPSSKRLLQVMFGLSTFRGFLVSYKNSLIRFYSANTNLGFEVEVPKMADP